MRDLLLCVAFRVHALWLDLEVVHAERATRVPVPSLIVFNYAAPYAPMVVLRALPRTIRRRVVAAADAAAWSPTRQWQGRLIAFVVRAFPFTKSGGAGIRSSLATAQAHLADGRAVLISPEGAPAMSERIGPFLEGIGLLATRAKVPIVPFRLLGYSALYPGRDPGFPWLPSRRGHVRLIVGEPLLLPEGLSRRDATALARRAVEELTAGDAPVGRSDPEERERPYGR